MRLVSFFLSRRLYSDIISTFVDLNDSVLDKFGYTVIKFLPFVDISVSMHYRMGYTVIIFLLM